MTSHKFKYIGMLAAIIFATLIPVSAHAVSEAGLIWLLIEPGSNAGGMGNAYVARTNDGYASWWNTGALAFSKHNQVAFMHSNWLQGSGINDIYYEYLGGNTYVQDLGTVGMDVTYLNYGKQDRTDEDNTDLGTFQSFDTAVAASYGFLLTPKVGLGMKFKFIWSNLAPSGTGQTETETRGSGTTYAFDLGVKAQDVLIPRLDLGLALQNVGPNITYMNESQSDPMPMNLRAGFAYRVFDSPFSRLTVTGDINKMLANDDPVLQRLFSAWHDDKAKDELESTIFNGGVEYLYSNLLALRAGYIYDKAGSVIGPCFGAGFQHTFSSQYKVSLDFAMTELGELLDYNKTFSIGFEF